MRGRNAAVFIVMLVICQTTVQGFWFDFGHLFKPMVSKPCKPISQCKMACPNGFLRDENGCRLCQCAGKAEPCKPISSCKTACPNGFLRDEDGCRLCQCASKTGMGTFKREGSTNVVQTTSGPVIGKTITLPTGKLVDEYLGIRYAKANRFEKPQAPKPWTEPFYADSFGPNCPQRQGVYPNGTKYPEIAEDCLYINVFVPKRQLADSERFCAMHWIHGGSYNSYSGDQVGAEVLASEGDVIVVTSNYRLGALGYLTTGDTDLPGNYGMFDQLKALEWVQDNIRSFGGDPANVTLFGESAGAFSVSLHMLSPHADDLFHQAIAESGAATALASLIPIEQAQKTARKFAKNIGCEMDSLKSCLLNKTFEEIYAAQAKTLTLKDLTYLTWAPVVDGDYLMDSPDNLLNKGQFKKRNVLQGFNNDEGGLFVYFLPGILVDDGVQRWLFEFAVKGFNWIANQTAENADSILFQYTNWTDPQDPISTRRSLIDLISDVIFKAPTIQTVKAYSKDSLATVTYLYQLEHGPDVDWAMGPMPDWLDAYHFADVTYVFGIPLLQPGATYEDPEVKFSMEIMKMWSNFAKKGNPTPDEESSLQWPQYNSDTQKYLALKPENFEVKAKIRPEYMEFWNEYLPKQTCVITSCVNQPDGSKFPYPGDCKKYYVCKDEKGIEKSCFLGSYFSIYTHKCTLPALSGCKMEDKRRK